MESYFDNNVPTEKKTIISSIRALDIEPVMVAVDEMNDNNNDDDNANRQNNLDDDNNNNNNASNNQLTGVANSAAVKIKHSIFQFTSNAWIPDNYDIETIQPQQQELIDGNNSVVVVRENNNIIIHHHHPRSNRRRLFLLITEPESSWLSGIVFALLLCCTTLLNLLMIIETVSTFLSTPEQCRFCDEEYDEASIDGVTISCICPPVPDKWIVQSSYILINIFAVEWIVRVLSFVPPPCSDDANLTYMQQKWKYIRQFISFLLLPSTLLDALATFPYYMESESTGFAALRLLRLARVFQFLKLGKYSESFVSFMNVLTQALVHLKLLIIVLFFGAILFGSLLYWTEQGTWGYYNATGTYEFLRPSTTNGNEQQISPYTSILASFWWFIVTATTVGYGDMVPTSGLGKFIATFAMLMGLLVIAFPVSVFSELWSKEFEKNIIKTQQQLDTAGDPISATIKQSTVTQIGERNNSNSVHNHTHNGSDDTFVPTRNTTQGRESLHSYPNNVFVSLPSSTNIERLGANSNINKNNNNINHQQPSDSDNYIILHKDDFQDILDHIQSITTILQRSRLYNNEQLTATTTTAAAATTTSSMT